MTTEKPNWKYTHNRKITGGITSLTMARTGKQPLEVLTGVLDELEPILVASGFLDKAPFKYPDVSVRFGIKFEEKPHFLGINKTYGDLGLGIEVKTETIINSDKIGLYRILKIAVLKSLIAAGKKYDLPIGAFETLLSALDQSEWNRN